MRALHALALLLLVGVAPTFAACPGAPPASVSSPSPRPPADAVDRLAAAIVGHDAAGAAALFAADASVTLIGDPEVARGRAAIETRVRALLDAFPDAGMTLGRTWSSDAARVVELVFHAHARASGRPVGVVGAVVLEVDAHGLVGALRVYLDVVTVRAQIDPSLVPAGVATRAVTRTPPEGQAVLSSRHSAEEARRLELANASWAALSAHDPAGVLASASDDYVYEDFSGPAPLSRTGTHALLRDFLGLVDGFTIVAKPVQFAAGDDVVTEMVEHMSYQGRAIELHGLDVKRFVGEQVVREWQYANYVEVMTALAP